MFRLVFLYMLNFYAKTFFKSKQRAVMLSLLVLKEDFFMNFRVREIFDLSD